jgi:hypothetical protein
MPNALAAAASNRALMGILCMLLASSLLPVMNGLVQILSQRYSTEQVLWARASSHLVFILALFAPRYGVALVRSSTPGSAPASSSAPASISHGARRASGLL